MAFSRWVMTATLGILLAVPVRAQTPDASQIIEASRKTLQDTLTSGGTTAAQKEEAARRLMERQLSGTRDFFLSILTTGGRDAKVAVAKAISDAAAPDPLLIRALSAMLGPDRVSAEAAVPALANYRENADAQKALLDFAQDIKQPPASRIAAIRALADFTHPAVAGALIELLADVNQSPAVRDTAAQALRDMTGQQAFYDATQWRQWFAGTPKSESAWIAQQQAAHAALKERQARQETEFAHQLQLLVENQYQGAPDSEKDRLMASFLSHPLAQMRLIGIDLYSRAFSNRQYQPPVGKERIPALLGDSDKQVRLAAAQAVQLQNLVESPTPVVAQLVQEPDPDVRAALVSILRSLQGAEVQATLLQFLNDPSLMVVTAVADALHDLGAQIRQKAPSAAKQLGDRMLEVARNRSAGPRGAEFEAAIVRKLGPMRDPELLRGLASSTEPVTVRVAALQAMGDIKNDNVAQQLARDFQLERNVEVRMADLAAIARIGTFELNGSWLYQQSLPGTEANPVVRTVAQKQFEILVQSATDRAVLKNMAFNLRGTLQQIPVQKVLVQRLQEAFAAEANPQAKEQLANDLASEQQSLGEQYLSAGDARDAIEPFRQAMNFWSKQAGFNAGAAQLVNQLMTAYLEDGRYHDACTFAADQIRGKTQAGDVQAIIRNFAESLTEKGVHDHDAQKLNSVVNLVDEASKLELEPRIRRNLNEFQKEAEIQLKALPRTAAVLNPALFARGSDSFLVLASSGLL